MQTTAEQITALPPAAAPEPTVDEPKPTPDTGRADLQPIRAEPVSPASAPEPSQSGVRPSVPTPQPEPAEAAAQRERLIRELLGVDDEKPRRRWRRH